MLHTGMQEDEALVERFLALAQKRAVSTVSVPVQRQNGSHKPPRDRSFGGPHIGSEVSSSAKAPSHSRAGRTPEAGAQSI